MRRAILTAGLAVIAGFLSVSAVQQSATLTLKSGTTLTGELVDLGGSDFAFRVNGQDRDIPKNDVAWIDFGGGDLNVPAAARDLPGGQHLAILRNGDVVQGEFFDVGGAQPIRITFRTGSGERVLNGSDVRRIYMTRAEGGGADQSAGDGQSTTVTVSARQWTSTGITVTRGQTLRFEASGEVTFAPGGRMARPAGSVDNLFDTRAPLPSVPQGALIGRIGAARAARISGGAGAFPIAGQNSVVMPAAGMLFLGVNDSGLNDNSGNFTVKITR